MKRTPFAVDEDLVRTLARLLDETGLTEIEAQTGDQRIRVARQPAAVASIAGLGREGAAAVASDVPPAAVAEHPGTVKSPMVGTVYLSSQPGATPFVKPGDRVTQGQTLMIVEAMKVMNPIAASRAGVVKTVLVEDGAPVEYGQPLIILD